MGSLQSCNLKSKGFKYRGYVFRGAGGFGWFLLCFKNKDITKYIFSMTKKLLDITILLCSKLCKIISKRLLSSYILDQSCTYKDV